MNFESRIKALSNDYLGNVRAPNITGLVDQLFRVASDAGSVGCEISGNKELLFFAPRAQGPCDGLATCTISHEAAPAIVRMLCARLGVICREETERDVSLYGDSVAIERRGQNAKRWNISFNNTTEKQGFLIEAIGSNLKAMENGVVT